MNVMGLMKLTEALLEAHLHETVGDNNLRPQLHNTSEKKAHLKSGLKLGFAFVQRLDVWATCRPV